MKIKSFSQVIKEAKEDDAKAIYLASEIDLIDKAEDNVKSDDPKKKTPEIEKKRKELAGKYKEITGHEDTTKSIPEAKNDIDSDAVIDLADAIMNKYPKAKKELDSVMYNMIDVENIRHYSHKDLVQAHGELKKIEKKYKSVNEGYLDDLGVSDMKDFGQKYIGQIKRLVGEIGGTYVGYFYDVPTKSIAIVTDKGIGKYFFDPAADDFEEYQKMDFLK